MRRTFEEFAKSSLFVCLMLVAGCGKRELPKPYVNTAADRKPYIGKVYVYKEGTTELVALYVPVGNHCTNVPMTNPIISEANGNFSFCTSEGKYRVVLGEQP